MSLKFFSIKEEKIDTPVKLQSMEGSFVDRAVDRLNKAYNESKKDFNFQRKPQSGKTASA